ncbi:hypothetical protein AT6N2_C1352 [Agrobacterium tumefaciens]|nr:hypothetical protein AT6N2_C1352 [Agrobacterium tumefaciens]
MEKFFVIGRSSQDDGAICPLNRVVLASNGGTGIDPLETAVRIDDERGEGHGEDRHEKRKDCQSADKLCHVHSPSFEFMDKVLPYRD